MSERPSPVEEHDSWVTPVSGVILGSLLVLLFGVGGNSEEVQAQGSSAINWMLGRWNLPGFDMSHGWLIPLMSLYLVWRKREDLKAAQRTSGGAGWTLVVASLLLYLLGLRIQQTRLVLFSLIGLLLGIPWVLYGRAVARLLVFPCFYLVFCIPFSFLDALTLPLRLAGTLVSATVLNGLGIPVMRVGTAIQVHAGAGFALDVAHPCSGLRYLVAMVALTTAYAYLTQKGTWRRGALFLASIPIAMAGNMVRIILIAVVGVFFGSDVAVGFYHDYSGYVVFAVAILLMIGVGNLLTPAHGNKRKESHEGS